MEDSEEQIKTRAVVDIIKEWEEKASELSSEANVNIWSENSTDWKVPMDRSQIIRGTLGYRSIWVNDNEPNVCQRDLAARALGHYRAMLKHLLTTLSEHEEQVLELMSGGIDGR